MQVVVHDPHVLLRIVRVHLDLVRAARALHGEDLVVLRPRLHHAAVAIDDDDAVLPFPLLRAGRLALERHAELRACRQRKHAALDDPHPVRRLREDAARRSPRVTLGARNRLRPVLDDFVRPEFVLAAFFLHQGRRGNEQRATARRRVQLRIANSSVSQAPAVSPMRIYGTTVISVSLANGFASPTLPRTCASTRSA